MGIFAINTGSSNLKNNSWYHFFVEMNKYFRFAKWKPDTYKLQANDVALLFIDEFHEYDLSIIPSHCKKIAIVKRLHIDYLNVLEKCDYIIYLNPYQKIAAESIMELTIPSIACPKHPTIDYKADVNMDNFVFFGGILSPEKIVGMADRIKYMHAMYSNDTEFLIFPNMSEIDLLKQELAKLEMYRELKSRIIYVNGDILSYSALKFRMRTAKYTCLWTNGMPIEMIDDCLNEKNQEIVEIGINESSMLALASSGNSQLLVDEEIDYISHFRCKDSFTYHEFAKILQNYCSNT
jgi:hypothetical protein